MKLEEFEKLETAIKKQNFYESYKGINSLLFYLSILGNIASVFCGIFFLAKLILGSVTVLTNIYVIYTISFILLTCLELLKRDIFAKFSIEFIRYKSFVKKEVAILSFFSLFVVFFSFYASLSGAKEFSSKSEHLELEQKTIVTNYNDSLNKIASDKILAINKEIDVLKQKDESKDKEQTELEGLERLTSQQKNRVKDLKAERLLLKEDISKSKAQIDTIQAQTKRDIAAYTALSSNDIDKQKEQNSSNSFTFIVISTIIELLILIGIYFNKNYGFKSYEEFKNKYNNDPSFQRWKLTNSLVEALYMNGPKVGDKALSATSLHDVSKINGATVTAKEVQDAIKLFTALKILKLSGNARYFEKDKETAISLVRTHFKID